MIEHEGNILSGVVAGDGSLELYVIMRGTPIPDLSGGREVYLEEEYKYEAQIILPDDPEKSDIVSRLGQSPRNDAGK